MTPMYNALRKLWTMNLKDALIALLWINFQSQLTNFMVFIPTPGHTDGFSIYFNNETLPSASSVKFLRVFIDSKLTWNDHIWYLCSQVAKGVGIIGRLKDVLPENVLRSFYLSLSHLSYCSLSWSSISNKSFSKLTVLLHVITLIYFATHWTC